MRENTRKVKNRKSELRIKGIVHSKLLPLGDETTIPHDAARPTVAHISQIFTGKKLKDRFIVVNDIQGILIEVAAKVSANTMD